MTDLLPLLPLRTVMFPGMPIPLRIFEERYRRMLDQRQQDDPVFGIVLLRSGRDTDVVTKDDLYDVGTATRLVSRQRLAGGQSAVAVQGTRRFSIQAVNWDLGYGLATIEWHDDLSGDAAHLATIMPATITAFNQYVAAVTTATGRSFTGVRMSADPVSASWELASRLPLHTWERQRLLELETAEARFVALAGVVRRERRLLADAGVLGVALDHPGQTFTLN